MPWSIRWTDWSESHIARHGLTPADVEQAVCTRPRLVARGRDGTTLVFGTTDAGGHVVVVLAPDDDTTAFVVTARSMTDREKAAYRRRAR